MLLNLKKHLNEVKSYLTVSDPDLDATLQGEPCHKGLTTPGLATAMENIRSRLMLNSLTLISEPWLWRILLRKH
jgi:hypothetical protein